LYELIQVGERTYYINSPVKIGIFRESEEDVYVIDSGNDKEAGKKVLKILKANEWNLKAIINTHSNADHIGGNRYLQQQTGCKIFAKGIEAAFTKYPILEPSFLYGGFPMKELRHKFLMAKGSEVIDIDDQDFPKELEIIDLPGHFFDMIGIKTPDDVIFLADCISSREILEKYAISFIYDVNAYLKTLDEVEKMKSDIFIPAHTDVSEGIKELVGINRKKVLEIADKIIEFCKEPSTFDIILKKVFDTYGLVMNFEQYVLVGSTIRSYLSWLKDEGKITSSFQENKMLWKNI
jgi:glyoxylase-like metal-dependent hydrolase (beta-lactamase superfamily II)